MKQKKRNKKQKVQQAFEDLSEFCRGESLSLPTLRDKLEACPEAIQAHGDGNTLLHFVCFNDQVTLEIVQYLYDLYPEAVEHLSSGNSLPLHRACLNNKCPSSIVEFLVSKFPGALRISWPHRGLPLHCSLSRSTRRYDCDDNEVESGIPLDLSIVKCLIEAYPEALTNRENDSEQTPLFLACQRDDFPLELARILVDTDLASLSLPGGYNGNLPLHELFASRCPPFEVVQFLIESAPETLGMNNANGEVPMHLACQNKNMTLAIIQLLVKQRHGILEQRNSIGNLPLHTACIYSQDLEIVKYMVQEYPEAIRTQNHLLMHPLQYASGKSIELTRFLVETFPESVRNRDSGGELPFHGACRQGSLETIKFLYELYPQSVTQKTFWGKLPLHMAAANKGNDMAAKICFLMQKYPGAVKEVDSEENLPLHFASRGADLSTIKIIFDAFPKGIHFENAEGCLPIHFACSKNFLSHADEIIRFLANQLPYGVKAHDKEGRVPAHYACKNLRLKDLMCLIDLYPDALRTNSVLHGLPIHYACTHRVDYEIVEYLESLYPESLEVHNESVGLPLHCAERKEVFIPLFLRRYQSYLNKGVPALHALFKDNKIDNKTLIAKHVLEFDGSGHSRIKDKRGALPLHLAVTTPLEMDFVDELILHCPEAKETQDLQGSLPLHYALRHQPSLELVKRLSASTKQNFLQTADHQGWTPLHVACRHGSSLEVVQHLVDADETTVHLKDPNNELPLHKACRGGHIDLVRYLLERDMPSVGERNSSGLLPLFLLCQSSGKKGQDNGDTPEYLESIWLLLKSHPEAIICGV